MGRVYVAAVEAVVESVVMAVLLCFRNLPKAQLGLFSGLSAIAFMMRLRSISYMRNCGSSLFVDPADDPRPSSRAI